MDVPNCGTEDYAAAKRLLEVATKVGPISEGAHAVAMAQVHASLAQTAVWAAFGLDDMVEPARTEWATTLGLTLDDGLAANNAATEAAQAAAVLPTVSAASAPTTFAGQVGGVIQGMFSRDVAETIIASDAFGALVYRLREYCGGHWDTDQIIRAFNAALTPNELTFCGTADEPAAFLAAKVRDLL